MTYSSPLWLTSKVLAMFSVFPAVFHGWKDGDILWHGMKSETSDMVKFTNVKEQYHAVIRGNILLKSKMIEIGLRFRQYLPVTPLLALGPLYSIHSQKPGEVFTWNPFYVAGAFLAAMLPNIYDPTSRVRSYKDLGVSVSSINQRLPPGKQTKSAFISPWVLRERLLYFRKNKMVFFGILASTAIAWPIFMIQTMNSMLISSKVIEKMTPTQPLEGSNAFVQFIENSTRISDGFFCPCAVTGSSCMGKSCELKTVDFEYRVNQLKMINRRLDELFPPQSYTIDFERDLFRTSEGRHYLQAWVCNFPIKLKHKKNSK
ncbi:unnamed protein product [Oikopleura dioica]|uniref:Uncharacterized protein n=1 Tax=Oikopleura dioica TaxID=34765 RepID=E4WQF5_OIKDI|nr:unnamed protein product [Oikopleura dioica]